MDFRNTTLLAGAADAWNAAAVKDLSISPQFIAYNVQKLEGLEQEGLVALEGSRVAGFAIASQIKGMQHVSPKDQGWIDAVVVHPAFQRQGVGSGLMDWAEGWLKKRGVSRASLGGSIHAFMPSLAEELDSLPFFQSRGYTEFGETWDVARDLGDGKPLARRLEPQYADIAPAAPGDEKALEEFLEREFNGGWSYEAREFLRHGGQVTDFMLLRQVRRVEGFAWLTFADSARPLDRYYMQRLPKPWGQLGPIGVSKAVRGAGWGGLLLQAGLLTLRSKGVRGCVIDWTGLLDFYGKYGFKPYRRYRMVSKLL